MSAGPLVLIPCGGRKVTWPCQARNLYIGSYFKACLYWARATTDLDRIRILSAKHGLLGLWDWVEPYDLRMGQAGAVDADLVRGQAAAQGLLEEPEVVVAMGQAYAKVALAVWPHAVNILAGTTGIGEQMQTLGERTRWPSIGGPCPPPPSSYVTA